MLEGWFGVRDEHDVVIKQNTGGGKTVVGLLIAQSSLNEGIGPAIYLAADTYLVEQVILEAGKLGLAVERDPTAPRFIAHEAILVTTFQRLINGLSVFGVDGSNRPVVDLGTIIVDDAHAALTTVEDQFSMRIPSDDALYEELIEIFKDGLKQQSESTFREIREGASTALLRIPFWDWYDKQQKVIAAFGPHMREDAFKFQWPLIRDQIAISSVTVTGQSIDIRPPVPPIHKIPSFGNARRRIYLTATLADDAVLVQDLNANPLLIHKAVTPGRASDIGDRVILAPMELNPSLDPDAILEFARQYADGWPDKKGRPTRTPINVVVLVPSNKAMKRWEPFADRVWKVGDLEKGVAELKAGHVGLVVLANKYDGIDLAENACRLLIIDGLPVALDAVERREASALVKSPKVLSRQVQRVEQGMGRGVRDGEDYCAVLLLGNSLTRVIHDPKQRAMFSPATEAQIQLSRDLAEQLVGEGLDGIAEATNLCIDQNPGWVRQSRANLAKTDYRSEATLRPSLIASRVAFEKAVAHDFAGASDVMREAANGCTDPAERGWLMEQQAVYRQATDPGAAQQILLSASTYNHHVLHPIAGISYTKIKAATKQAEAAGAYIKDHYVDGLDLVLGVRSLMDDLQWDETLTEQAEATWQAIGELLGFASERPDKQYHSGPDNLWAMSNGIHLLAELKTGAIDQPIKKDYVDELGGHVRWHEKQYGKSQAAVPVFVHKSSTYHHLGTPPSGTRVFTEDGIERLKDSIAAFAVSLVNPADWANETVIAEQLALRNLTPDALVKAFTIPVTPAPAKKPAKN